MTLSKIILISACTLIVILGITAALNSAADGNNVIGFPFVFYEYLGGKRFPEPTTRHWFNFCACAIDVILLFGVPFTGLLFYQRKQKTKKK
ncbi:hypothetical protein OQX63_10660 [Pedobacter sp. PF22-3]|uniref:hypothetical protein n=1 Tax=Pedobacter sp. PF22-3 TaxID=2994467 RepID=UPI0022476083|nr:hypothetical protein [Pedobacter sp. PF22-3]MCX2493936.1 hypothetical protein [Pedobacter sp. PF22-3]